MPDTPQNRWIAETGGTRGPDYAQRFRELAAAGEDVHGEAALVDALVAPRSRVLDAGCGTGRVGIELARRGHEVTGVDLDASMLAEARADAPDLAWVEADLAALELPGPPYDAVVLAGNVVVYLTPATERQVVRRLAAHLRPGGLLVAGFRVEHEPGVATPADYDAACAAAGLEDLHRWASWDRAPWDGGGYVVRVHRLPDPRA
ncbi:class I SAM-dependent methyltransferase [Vallicoccus soli]|uniref:Class I SAM-dependent methyltransferase n=1 Tax=Vallicoccus soli TaxID=2339232 RepID=A0A3A3Z3L0_9ACTN|nr:class I SAM-dependent methyltransferase [Vallicoccus soli]RJK98004.1 class I SAM-dependent methyltransferase [Vallicoccus soli]